MKHLQCMDLLITNMSGFLTGTIKWEIRKTTRMSVERYLSMLSQQLTNRVEGILEFQPIPQSLDLHGGSVGRVLQTSVTNIQVNLQLSCKKYTNEDMETKGSIALIGTAKLGAISLAFNLELLSGIQWSTKEDPTHIRWQELSLKIPLTHIHLSSIDGCVYRLSYQT